MAYILDLKANCREGFYCRIFLQYNDLIHHAADANRAADDNIRVYFQRIDFYFGLKYVN